MINFHFLLDLFSKAHPAAQVAILAIVLIAWMVSSVYSLYSLFSRKDMKRELGRKEVKLKKSQQKTEKLNFRLATAEERSQRLDEEKKNLSQELGGLEQKLKATSNRLEETETDLKHVDRERRSLEDRFEQLRKLDTSVWMRAYSGEITLPLFVPRDDRKTTFIAVQNLKGGVGKTTLVANLGAAYATGITGRPLNVLVIDLDYQGTLSNCCVEARDLKYRRDNKLSSACLLDGNDGAPADLLAKLLAPIPGTNDRGKAIIAYEDLEQSDFRQQARFAVNSDEVRFCHRRILHSKYVFDTFDLVFFDCPPRLTTSSINALIASDYVIIPTTLHPFDVEAVPRTLRWLTKLGEIDSFRARFGGIVINRTHFKVGSIEKLTKDEDRQLGILKSSIRRYDPTGSAVFVNAVCNSPEIRRSSEDGRPLATSTAGHEIYGGVSMELYERLVS